MALFRRIYSFLVERFFNSLTKKLVGLFLFFLGAQALTVIVAYSGRPSIPEDLGLSALLAALFALLLFFLRALLVRPVQQISEVLALATAEEGDISVRVPRESEDEFGDLAEALDRFLGHLRRMFLDIHITGAHIAVSSAKVARKVEGTTECAREQGALARDIFAGSSQTTAAQGEISSNTQEICASTSSNLETARNSFQELMKVSDSIQSMNDKLANYGETITGINDEAQDIKGIVSLIKSISTQTSMLALNAAIEAARAGAAGKGFSIVAEEVKKLAEQVNAASEDISGKITSVVERIENSMTESKVVARLAGDTREAVGKSCLSFQEMIEEFEKNDSQLQSITASVEELSASSEEINAKVSTIQKVSQEVEGLIQDAGAFFQEMTATTEKMQEMVSRFKIGEGYLETVIFKSREYRDKTEEILERMVEEGLDVFDRNFQPIPGTDPQKYHTVYDKAFEANLKPLFDRMLGELDGCLYALALDCNGYCPTHNSKFSQPPTGDYETDLVASRDKRIYTDPIGLRAVQHTKRFLLQAYLRDTGEIMSELSMPVRVGGRHWGGFRVGVDPAILLHSAGWEPGEVGAG